MTIEEWIALANRVARLRAAGVGSNHPPSP